MLLKNNLNKFLKNLNNKKQYLYSYLDYYINNIKNYYINNSKEYKFNIYVNNTLSYNIIIKNIIKNFLNKKRRIKYTYYEKFKKEILNVKKTSLKVKNTKNYRFKLITCIGSGDKWLGLGNSEGGIFKKSFVKSINTSKKYIYNLNFKCNDYKYLKYKGCKFRSINMTSNKKNLKIYDSITKVSGYKKIKLISYASKTPINIIKSIFNCF